MPSKNSTTEEKLQFSELRYRRLFEAAQDGILILDSYSGNIVDVNPFLQKLLGYSEKELLGKKLWQIGVFKDIIDSKKAFIELQTKGYIRYKDLPLETKKGKTIDVEFVSNLYDVGNLKVIQCNIRDISDRINIERKQEKTRKAMLNIMEDLEVAKNAMEVAKVRDDAMLASIGEGLIAVDNDGRVMIINKIAEEMLGWKSVELIGKKITSLPLEDESGQIIPFSKRPTTIALHSGQMTKVSHFFVRKDKTRFPIAVTATPIKLGKQQLGLIEIIRDITYETEVDKAKSEFVSLASHQLRTPLGIAKWYLEALENEVYIRNAPDIVRSYLNEIVISNERVLRLVGDLLSVSRIDQRRVKNTPDEINPVNFIKEIIQQMQIMTKTRKVQLKFTSDNAIPLINIDALRFHEVIENLIGNAIEYSKDKGIVDINVSKVSKSIIISVKDRGYGISQADQKNIFTKFFRTEKAVQLNPEGSGLGLYVVKSYVEGWGGQITAKSDLDKGSTFTISLPIMIGGD